MQKTSPINNFLRSRFVLLLSAVICFASAYFISGKGNSDFSSTAEKFAKILHEKEEHAEKELDELSEKTKKWSYKELFSEKPEYYKSLFEREGLVFLIFENDTLCFWTDNTVAVDNRLSRNNFNDKIVKLPNGWFGIEKFSIGNKELLALILLKREYAYQNKYLANEFQNDFNLNGEVKVWIDADKIGKKQNNSGNIISGDVYEAKGDYLCTLVFPSSSLGGAFTFYFAIILNFLGLFFAIWFLQAEADSLSDKIGKGWTSTLLIFSVVVLRYLTIEIHFPHLFYETKIFSPELYGDASYIWLGSLGDLLMNALLVFYLTFKISSTPLNPTEGRNTGDAFPDFFPFWGRGASACSFILLTILFFSSTIINYVFEGIIRNSNIPFTLNDIFSQNVFTYTALSIISLFFISYFLLLDKTIDVIRAIKLKRKEILIITVSSIVVFTVISHLLGTVDLILVFWPVLLFAFVAWAKEKQFRYSFSVIVVLLFIISFFSAHVVSKNTDRKEHESRKIFAQKLSTAQDPLAEHLFTEVEIPISTDTVLIHLLAHPYHKDKSPANISSDKKENFTRHLISKYFSGYWEKYEIKISVFDTACLPLVQGSSPDRDNLNYFEEVISSEGISTESNRFYYLKNSTGRTSYLARIPLIQTNDFSFRIGDLFIEFDSRIVSDEMGFPELMLDRKLGIVQDLLDYSYSKYKDGKLISYHGKFPYSLSAESFLPARSIGINFPRTSFSEMDGYTHLSYMTDERSLVVISKKDEGLIAVVTTFSYLFAFFSMALLLLLFLRMLILKKNIRIDSFRSRIQFVLVSMVFFSLLFFGAGTIYYINRQYDLQTRQSVRDKMVSALVEATRELGSETELKFTKQDFFSYVMKRMSTIFMTDMSLYNKEGNLVGSSQMKMFDEGLLSRKMSPESYYRLAIKQNIEFIHDEKIGHLEYLSAYCSLRNNTGDLLGYLNIPYFARQSELEKEISTILSAIINIYVLLFVISVILALTISEYFTKPLKLIQEKLSKIKLGQASEPIEWKSQDEIGSLVNEYNRMIDELQKSAELLAKSERETAWREMAKQVAHEIKNPLTPMKLSIQHLQRTWKKKDDDMDKKIERITQTVIEQIEALSTIASEFASFAKMPVTVSEKINVRNVLENTIALFKDATDTEITFDSIGDDAFVYADKEQMLRVCNNLLKNALQAIPENRQGKIDVSLTRKDTSLLIKIKDNGTGIAEDKMNKIFLPNFTTKTGGMGLGLAMVKSIVETFGGKIWFETSRGNGSMFFVSLPEYK
ncbi:MAG: ATP-binding protein [Bacteroidota bacterium]